MIVDMGDIPGMLANYINRNLPAFGNFKAGTEQHNYQIVKRIGIKVADDTELAVRFGRCQPARVDLESRAVRANGVKPRPRVVLQRLAERPGDQPFGIISGGRIERAKDLATSEFHKSRHPHSEHFRIGQIAHCRRLV